MEPKGTIVFSTVGRPYYGFDIFSVTLSPDLPGTERRLTDGISVNFNGEFVDEDGTLIYVSERTGAQRIHLKGSDSDQQFSIHRSIFHDRPSLKNGKIYFVSAHEQPSKWFHSWSAVYSLRTDKSSEPQRLTPYGVVDYSPAVSESGKYIAVASYGSSRWGGEFHDLETDIVVFPESDPNKRILLFSGGGWPTWAGDKSIFFHRQTEDGWWSIFKVDLPKNFNVLTRVPASARRVTPEGVHCFTPAAFHKGTRIAVATRRPETNFRHIEIFDTETEKFIPVTEKLNPNFHHYNPFISPDSGSLGYHRFRGEAARGTEIECETIVPNLEALASPVKEIRLVRINGSFPSFSPSGKLLAFNHDFEGNSGLKVVKSDGSKRWTLLSNRPAFHTCWSPTEEGVIYTSIGPVFASSRTAVQVGRISFDPNKLENGEVSTEIKILTKDGTDNNAFPSCSPDGKRIVFRSGRSGYKNLYIISAVEGEFSGEIQRLTAGPWIDTMPAWSPDGELIAFSSNRHDPTNWEVFGIYVIRPDGTGLRRIHVSGPEGSDEVYKERVNHVCFSPDGQWLLFTANIAGITAEPVSFPNQFQPYGELFVMRMDGSGLRRLTFNAYEDGTPTWRSDAELDIGGLTLDCKDGDELKGQFEEPRWLTCDI